MLENEPDTDHTSTDADPSTPPTTPPPRRRRAASRPAGPPAAAETPPTVQLNATPLAAPEPVPTQVETSVPEHQQAEVSATEQPQNEIAAPTLSSQPEVSAADLAAGTKPAKKAAAKRPARKTAAKKATSVAPSGDDSPASADVAAESSPPTPRKRAPRKRATTKAAETRPSGGDPVAESDQGTLEVTSAETTTSDAEQQSSTTSEPAHVTTTEAPESSTLTSDASPVDVTDAKAAATEGPAGWAPAPDEEPGAVEEATAESPDSPSGESRDFGWLADPFAVPAGQQNSPQGDAAKARHGDAPAEGTTDADHHDGADNSSDDRASDDDDESGDGSNRRRRRRRGGRRRRRGGGEDDSNENTSDDTSPDDSSEDGSSPTASHDADSEDEGTRAQSRATPRDRRPAAPADDTDSDDDSDEDSQGQRRRRRRRRRGEEAAASPDDPTDVVVRVREPRPRKKAASDEVTGIQGSTRMEAKRQRRKEGRDAGRRRAPILSEAEFLARRESVNRKMIIRQREDLAQIAVLEDGILVEHYVDRDSAASLIGNVYLGRVQNVLPSMEAAFIDIGRGRNAVLYAGEVDWDSFGAEGHGRKVEKVLKSGQMILVQVSKDPVGAKGARLTNHVSIPGRYVVYAPGGHLSGISRKLPDVERRRLKDILADLVGESASVIVRTAAEGASEEELVRDVNRLKAQWADIERKVKAGNSPQLLYGEPDLTVRIVRDLFTEDFGELIIQGNGTMNDAYDAIMGYVTHVAPHLQERIRRWEPTGEEDLFSDYRLDEQIAKGLERKVFLPSGGSLVIDRTEAMTVIDVNTGKFTGTGGNLEATVTSNNLEAAEEIVNQLRLRDIGGIIVIDFIDMVLPSNRELLLRRLVECLGRDRTRHQVAEVTSLGLVQMTRKKIGTGLHEAFATECPTCLGRGYLMNDAPVDSQKQADGGARDSRGQNHRPRPGDGTRTNNGSRGDAGSRSDSGSRSDRGPRGDSSRGDSGSRESGPHDQGQPQQAALVPAGGGPERDAPGTGEDGADESGRGRRSRRGRGAAYREQQNHAAEQSQLDVSATEADGDANPDPAPHDQPDDVQPSHDQADHDHSDHDHSDHDHSDHDESSRDQTNGQAPSNREFYDNREREAEEHERSSANDGEAQHEGDPAPDSSEHERNHEHEGNTEHEGNPEPLPIAT